MLDLVCTGLSQGERKVEIVDRPDRRAVSEVPPVDALLRVIDNDHDERWAADVCLASKKFDARIPAAMKELQNALMTPLTELAEKADRTLTISCRAYVRLDRVPRKEWNGMMGGYHRNIWDRVIMALLRPTGEWTDAEVSIRWSAAGAPRIGPRVLMSYQDPFSNEAFAFSPKVRRKLEGQLTRARNAGYRTLLILDQEPPNYVPWVGNILPTAYEIGEGIAFAVAHCRTTLDAAILVQDSSVHEVYGRVGKPAPCCCRCHVQ